MASRAEEITLTTCTQYAAYDHAKATTDCIAMASVRAPVYETQIRCPVDIVAVIDHSGSMAGEKLNLVKKTLLFIIDQLNQCDRLCLVLYDDVVNVEFPLTTMTKENKEICTLEVAKITDGGTTNLCGGLLKGMEQIIHRDSKEKNNTASVLLFTDGLANSGITDFKEIIAAMNDPINSLAKSGVLDSCTSLLPLFQGVQPFAPEPKLDVPKSMNNVPSCKLDFEGAIYTFGFGSDHDGVLLTALSNAANGVYYFIESAQKIPEYFADCLGGLLSVVGQKMTLTIEAQQHCVLGNIKYRNKPHMEPDNRKCVVSLGDLQSEEERDVIIPLNLEALESECMAQPLIKVTLSYLNIQTTLMQTISVDLAVDRKLVANLEPNKAVNTQLQRMQVALVLEEVKQSVSINPEYASAMLEKSKNTLLESADETQGPLCSALITDLNEIIDNLRDQDIHWRKASNSISSLGQETIGQRKNHILRNSSCTLDTTVRFVSRTSSYSYQDDMK